MTNKAKFGSVNGAILLIAIGSFLPPVARGQSGGSFNLSWSTIDGGGGTSSGGQFAVAGTIGQPDAGAQLTSGQFSLTGGFWSFLNVIQSPGAPILKIKLSGTNAIVSWPVSVSGFALEETLALNSGVWNATPQPIVDTGTEHTVTVPAVGVIRCFRLKHQ